MGALIRPFIGICLLRAGPQDLPSSALLLRLALAAYAFSSFLVLSAQFTARDALFGSLLDTALLIGLTVAVLAVRGHAGRIEKTLTALAGAGTVLTIVAFPFVAWVHQTLAADREPGIEALMVWVLIFWSVAVYGHVLRHALSISYLGGTLVAFAFYIVSINVVGAAFSHAL